MAASTLTPAWSEFESKVASISHQINELFEEMPFGSHSVAKDGTYLEVNPVELAWLECTREDLIGKRRPIEFLTPESREIFTRYSERFGAHGFAELELDLMGQNGSLRKISLSSNGFFDMEGRPRANRTVSFDLTKYRDDRNRQRIAALAFESLSGMCVTDSHGVVLRVNQAFTTLTGYSAEDIQGKTMHMLSSGHHDAAFYRAMWQSLKTRGNWEGEIYNRRKNGQIYTEWLSITSTYGPDGTVAHYVGSFFDITASRATQAEISHMAYFDTLTQLPNRHLMLDRLRHALAASARTQLRGAVLFIDLDNFKLINDTRGHGAGDLLLTEAARRLRSSVREGDSVARIGGDEFVVLLEGLDTDGLEAATQATKVSESILQILAEAYRIGTHEFHCTGSIGIAMFGNPESGADLLQHADLAMYQAKKAGRNAFKFFDDTMQTAVNARVSLEQDLRRAIRLEQFELYFQPQVSQGGSLVGAEALLRWHRGEKGLVSPGDFIPVAEESGLILSIGKWVLQAACAQLKQWEAHPLTRGLQLAVNVSARQFLQGDFVSEVQQTISEAGINPRKLKLEITESMVLNVEDAIDKMNALRAIGVFFSMDDFGTGYSSLSNLTRLPLNQLKIDQSFVRNIGIKGTDDTIVQTIIGMANTLGFDVIAEGVETEEQKAFLELNGCPVLQGYLLGKPVPIDAFEAWL